MEIFKYRKWLKKLLYKDKDYALTNIKYDFSKWKRKWYLILKMLKPKIRSMLMLKTNRNSIHKFSNVLNGDENLKDCRRNQLILKNKRKT